MSWVDVWNSQTKDAVTWDSQVDHSSRLDQRRWRRQSRTSQIWLVENTESALNLFQEHIHLCLRGYAIDDDDDNDDGDVSDRFDTGLRALGDRLRCRTQQTRPTARLGQQRRIDVFLHAQRRSFPLHFPYFVCGALLRFLPESDFCKLRFWNWAAVDSRKFSDGLFTAPTRTTQDSFVLSASAVWTINNHVLDAILSVAVRKSAADLSMYN